MGSQSTSTPEDDSLLFLKHLAGKVEKLSASLSEKEEEVMAERRTMSPKFTRHSIQQDVWDERVNPRDKAPQKNRGEIQRREAWMTLVKRAKKELTERELCKIPDLQILQRLLRLYKLDDPLNSARIELYWQEMKGMKVPEKGKLCESPASLKKIAPHPSSTPLSGISPRSGSVIYTNQRQYVQQLSPIRSISPPMMPKNDNGHIDTEGRDFHDLPKPVVKDTQPIFVSGSHSPSPTRPDFVKKNTERVRPPSVSVDQKSAPLSKASPQSTLYSARSGVSSSSPIQRGGSSQRISRPVFSMGGGSGAKESLRTTQLSPNINKSNNRTNSSPAGNVVNSYSGINRRYGNGPTSPNASDPSTIGLGRERDQSQNNGGITRHYSNGPADTCREIPSQRRSPSRTLSQKNVSSPYSIGNDGEFYKQVATIKSTNASNPYNIGGSRTESPGRRRRYGSHDATAVSNPNAAGDIEEGGSPRTGRVMSSLSHFNTTGMGSNPNPVALEETSPSRKRLTITTDSHGIGSNPNPYSDAGTPTSAKRSFSAPASQRQTWNVSGSLRGDQIVTCKKSMQSDARTAQAIGSSNSSLTMVNAGREGESRKHAAIQKEKSDGDQYFTSIPPQYSRVSDESSPRKPFSGIRMVPTKNSSTLSESTFVPNPIPRCQTPPGTRTGKAVHLIFGSDDRPNKTIKRICPLPHEKQTPSPNKRKQFNEQTQAAQSHQMEFN